LVFPDPGYARRSERLLADYVTLGIATARELFLAFGAL
jgi:hypothetical protein